MHKPKPKKHADCDQCDRYSPLLMPVGFAAGWPVIVWQLCCLECRLSSPSRPEKYHTPAEWLQFHHDAEIRSIYEDWLAANFERQGVARE